MTLPQTRIGRDAAKRLEAFCFGTVRGSEQALWHCWQRHAGTPESWDRPWENLGDRPGGIGEVAVGLNADALLTLVVTARDGRDLW